MATYPKLENPSAPEKKTNKVYVFIVDFDPEKKNFMKLVKRKTNKKTVLFNYEEFHNKTFSYLLEQYDDNRTFVFNIKDNDCREWLSLCLREIKKHNIIVVYKSKQPWIEKIEPQIIVPFKRFHKLILCQNPEELYDVRVHLPKPKNLIMRILTAVVNCFREKNKEYINC